MAILNVQVDKMWRSGAGSDFAQIAQAWIIMIVQVLQGRCFDPLGKVHVLLLDVVEVTMATMMLFSWIT